MASKKSIACIALENGKVLIAHRLPVGQMGDRWEFPGGKVEASESEETAIIREMQEEFGITVTVGEHIASASFVHNDDEVSLECFRIFVPHDGLGKERYILTEHSEYRWALVDEIPSLFFVDSDMKLYEHVKKYVERECLKNA